MSLSTVISQSQYGSTHHQSQSPSYHDHIHNIIHHMYHSHHLKSMSVSIIAYSFSSIPLNHHLSQDLFNKSSQVTYNTHSLFYFHLSFTTKLITNESHPQSPLLPNTIRKVVMHSLQVYQSLECHLPQITPTSSSHLYLTLPSTLQITTIYSCMESHNQYESNNTKIKEFGEKG